MSIKLYHYEPAEYSGMNQIIIAPFQWNANNQNTGPRLQYLANHLGQLIVSMPALDAVEADSSFTNACKWLADCSHEITEKQGAKAVGWGDSMAGMFVAGMQNHNPGTFERILLRDSFNLTGPQRTFRGYAKVISYNLKDALLSAKEKRQGLAPLEPHLSPVPLLDAPLSRTASLRNAVKEMGIVSNLMRSRISVDETLVLAANPTLPLHIVNLSQGMSGPLTMLEEFGQDLKSIRQQAILSNPDAKAAALKVSLEPRRHSALTSATLALRHLSETQTL